MVTVASWAHYPEVKVQLLSLQFHIFKLKQMFFYIEKILAYLALIVSLLMTIAFFTLYERQILAALQRRQGPNIVGFYGRGRGIDRPRVNRDGRGNSQKGNIGEKKKEEEMCRGA